MQKKIHSKSRMDTSIDKFTWSECVFIAVAILGSTALVAWVLSRNEVQDVAR
jgi:hypothetical protein